MALGWKVFIPVSLVNLVAIGLGVLLLGGPR
jgi:NADH:ubiquinone oxidoreductase subunit H